MIFKDIADPLYAKCKLCQKRVFTNDYKGRIRYQEIYTNPPGKMVVQIEHQSGDIEYRT